MKKGKSRRELYSLCKAVQTGNGNTLYYSNGQVRTNWVGKDGQAWYYSNGKVMTNWVRRDGQALYYSNGKVVTNSGNLIFQEEMLYPCSYIE